MPRLAKAMVKQLECKHCGCILINPKGIGEVVTIDLEMVQLKKKYQCTKCGHGCHGEVNAVMVIEAAGGRGYLPIDSLDIDEAPYNENTGTNQQRTIQT